MSDLTRVDGRTPDQLRTVKIERGWSTQAEGSALISFGETRVLCTASFTPGVPRWLMGKGTGWVTAEYSMLPRSTNERMQRESVRGKIGGRTHEISRLIGRSLRAVVDMKELGENTLVIDCDVLQADGGTRTAAITGAYVALADSIEWARGKGHVARNSKPLSDSVAADKLATLTLDDIRDASYYDAATAEGAVLAAPEKADVTIQLKWLPQAQFMGYYVALDKGYYTEAGLNVTIVPGGGDISETTAVYTGQVDFGVTWVSNLIAANAGGMGLIEVAQVFQRSGLVLVYKLAK